MIDDVPESSGISIEPPIEIPNIDMSEPETGTDNYVTWGQLEAVGIDLFDRQECRDVYVARLARRVDNQILNLEKSVIYLSVLALLLLALIVKRVRY